MSAAVSIPRSNGPGLKTLAFSLIMAFQAFSLSLIPYEEIPGPICVIRDTVTNEVFPLSPEKSQYNVIITDGLAHIRLTQMYVNQYPNINDIVYVFPLPHEGSVHAMSMEYLDSLYIARIYEKEEARTIYDSILALGGNAALLTQERPNIFQQKLANIAYGDTAYIRIELSMPLKYNDGEFELAVPTMVAERYQSSPAKSAAGAQQTSPWNPPENINGQRLQFNVMIQTGYPLVDFISPTHPLEMSGLDQSRGILEDRGVLEKEARLNPTAAC
ncbi:VIT domain-containing protein [Fibrobacterota bacterium]